MPRVESLEDRRLLATTVLDPSPTGSDPTATVIIDQGESGYSESGSWSNSGLPGYLESISRFSSRANARATWKPTLDAGRYILSVFRVTNANSTGAARFDIYHAGVRDTTTIDLRSGQSGWFDLGTFEFDGKDQESVVLSNATSGVLRADAVRWTSVDLPAPTPPVSDPPSSDPNPATDPNTDSSPDEEPTQSTVAVIDQGDTGYSESGSWSNSGLPGYQGLTSRFSTQASARASWKPALDAGLYNVSAFRVSHPNSTGAAQVEIYHAGVLDATTIDMSSGESDWINLGTFQFDGNDQESVVLSNATSGVLRADAVRWTSVDVPPPTPPASDPPPSDFDPETDSIPDSEPTTNTTTIVDQGDAGYSESGSWSNSGLSGYQGLASRFSSDSHARANWSPTLGAGYYTVSFYHVTHPNSTSAAKFEIHHADTHYTTTIDLRSGQSGWVELGTFEFDGNGEQQVVLSSAAPGVLRSDAVRWTPVNAPPSADEVSRVDVRAGGEESFLATMRTPSTGQPSRFYIYADAVLDQGLDIIGRQGDEIHFLAGAQVTSNVQAQGSWSDDRGAVNIVGSNNLVVTGLRATNTFEYQVTSATGDRETSTALNISRSQNISIRSAHLEGLGKSVLWIHSDSVVDVTDTTINGYYFCVGVSASDVTFSNLTTNQFNPLFTGDRHSVFWVSSSMRSPDNVVYKNTSVVLQDTTMNLRTGRAIVSGNGSYDAHSLVSFRGNTTVNATDYSLHRALGWANFHSNYHGFTVQLADAYPLPTRDLVQPEDDGEVGRFIVNTFQGGGRPSFQAAISVCEGTANCVTSDEVLGVNQPIDLVHGGLSAHWTAINPAKLSTDANGDLHAAYSAVYEAVIVNTAIENIDMTGATQLRIRAKVETPGEFRFRLSFVDETNSLIDPEIFTVTGGTGWQTLVLQLSHAVRHRANKIIIGSNGNSQDVNLEMSEIAILAGGAV